MDSVSFHNFYSKVVPKSPGLKLVDPFKESSRPSVVVLLYLAQNGLLEIQHRKTQEETNC
jgi:hypothetical protein